MKTFTQSYTVKSTDTAASFGSGLLSVFATPAMIALMENTATQTIDNLDDNFTTVGIEINARHLKASTIGETVICTAELINRDGKIYEFYIEVYNSRGDKIGTATHKRAAVNKIEFMKKLEK
ncbi:Thioesterase superfamily [uncultured Paludibacter sp.]|uniref:Thioesterase superfamily n=1 Tax=uncultured Paludibacter sp. TaxID=497635 RepID=A0A653A6R4_9BACT|nr:Thioesterase superfamily [uncultured Paludibacter sp.]